LLAKRGEQHDSLPFREEERDAQGFLGQIKPKFEDPSPSDRDRGIRMAAPCSGRNSIREATVAN
jgi:hypothetical protein